MVIKRYNYLNLEYAKIAVDDFHAELQAAVHSGILIRDLTTDQIIEALYKVYQSWAMPSHPMYQKYRNIGLSYLLSFLHPESIHKLLKKGLRNETLMDHVGDSGGFNGFAVPRGVVGHWVAGNVPLLSLISVLQAILTKNMSIVKLSTKQENWISPFLISLAETSETGKILANSVCVLSFPGEWARANEIMATHCDVKIAWGGGESVASVSALTGKRDSSTILFGPKFSCAVIDLEVMLPTDWTKLARDTVLFQQLACTSPHAILVKGGSREVEEAAKFLSEAYNKIVHFGYYQPLEAGETMKVLDYRTTEWMKKEQVQTSNGAEWTIHLHDKIGPLFGTGMYIVHLYPCHHLEQVSEYLPVTIQTISHRLNHEDLQSLIQRTKYSGVSRFVPVGETHTYDIPWDGMLVLDQLIKWIRVDA